MCGLIGFLSADSGAKGVEAAVDGSLVDMRHRGPDESGTWSDDDVVIGFIAGRKADTLVIESEKSGKQLELHADPKEVSSRGGKGHQVMKRVTFKLVPKPVTVQPLANAEGGQGVN